MAVDNLSSRWRSGIKLLEKSKPEADQPTPRNLLPLGLGAGRGHLLPLSFPSKSMSHLLPAAKFTRSNIFLAPRMEVPEAEGTHGKRPQVLIVSKRISLEKSFGFVFDHYRLATAARLSKSDVMVGNPSAPNAATRTLRAATQ